RSDRMSGEERQMKEFWPNGPPGFGVRGLTVSLTLANRPPLEFLAADLGSPGRRDPDQPLAVLVGQPRLDQSLDGGEQGRVEVLAQLVRDLAVERPGGDRRLFLLLGGLLVGLVVLVAAVRVPEPRPGAHDGSDHAAFLGLRIVRACEE